MNDPLKSASNKLQRLPTSFTLQYRALEEQPAFFPYLFKSVVYLLPALIGLFLASANGWHLYRQ